MPEHGTQRLGRDRFSFGLRTTDQADEAQATVNVPQEAPQGMPLTRTEAPLGRQQSIPRFQPPPPEMFMKIMGIDPNQRPSRGELQAFINAYLTFTETARKNHQNAVEHYWKQMRGEREVEFGDRQYRQGVQEHRDKMGVEYQKLTMRALELEDRIALREGMPLENYQKTLDVMRDTYDFLQQMGSQPNMNEADKKQVIGLMAGMLPMLQGALSNLGIDRPMSPPPGAAPPMQGMPGQGMAVPAQGMPAQGMPQQQMTPQPPQFAAPQPAPPPQATPPQPGQFVGQTARHQSGATFRWDGRSWVPQSNRTDRRSR